MYTDLISIAEKGGSKSQREKLLAVRRLLGNAHPLEGRYLARIMLEELRIGDLVIEPFATSHDAKEPCGFIIREGDLRFGYCTDTGVITPHIHDLLRNCDGIVLESNHCPDMLKNGPYPESLKRRIRSKKGHLSNPDAAACLRDFGRDVPLVILAHLSETNNTAEKAMGTAREGLGLFYDVERVTVATQCGTSKECQQALHL